MQMKLAYKIGTIAILFILFQIPLGMVENLIRERTNFRNEARSDIAQSWTGTQSIMGPILVVPYLENTSHQVWDEQLKTQRNEIKTERKHIYILPDILKVNGKVQIEQRQRGLYAVPVYTTDLTLEGNFSTQSLIDFMKKQNITTSWWDITTWVWTSDYVPNNDSVKLEPAYITITLSDLRGIVEQPRLTWKLNKETDSHNLEFRSGSRVFPSMVGMHVIVGEIDPKTLYTPTFSTNLKVRGMEQLQTAPVAKDTQVSLTSAWQHPSFNGRYLPREYNISESGFKANWQVSSFSSDMEGLIQNCDQNKCGSLLIDNFGVSFITPIDIYQQGERSVKYGILFIGLTFIAFFLFEIIKKLRLHAMHYLLVGLVLATFYLLLISFSEHIDFMISYVIATLSCTTLLAFYISGVMKNWSLGLIFAGKFLALYGMLYIILQSEDNALLMGSILIFVVLALVMSITRNLDWYKVGEQIEHIKTNL